VGFGKTEVAVRAAFKAVNDGKQVGLLVPTTILAEQHYNTFKERLSQFPVKVAVLSRFATKAKQKEIVEELENGNVDIVIGTHRLLSKDIKFKDLGLLIVDEEHRFGVMAKGKTSTAIRVNVDTLTLTATPIPRTIKSYHCWVHAIYRSLQHRRRTGSRFTQRLITFDIGKIRRMDIG
jgi:transcription-repair coupling factor (superfamily II helicase)